MDTKITIEGAKQMAKSIAKSHAMPQKVLNPNVSSTDVISPKVIQEEKWNALSPVTRELIKKTFGKPTSMGQQILYFTYSKEQEKLFNQLIRMKAPIKKKIDIKEVEADYDGI